VPRTALYGQYERLAGDYYAPALTDLIEASPAPDTARLIGTPSGVFDDRWCDGEVSLAFWHARPIERIALSFWLPPDAPPQAMEIAANGTILARRFLEAGEVTRVVCAIPGGRATRATLTCRFDFVFRLAAPDVRSCAAMLHQIALSDGCGWQPVDLPVSLLRRTG
jgi:hypothetical protein